MHGPRTSPQRLCPFSENSLGTPALYCHMTLWQQVAVSWSENDTITSEIAKRESQSLVVHTAPPHGAYLTCDPPPGCTGIACVNADIFTRLLQVCLVTAGSVLRLSNGGLLWQILDAFAILRTPTASFVMSVCPSVCPNGTTQLPLDLFFLNKILCFRIWNACRKDARFFKI